MITINGKAYEFKAGQTILSVCRENQIHVPTLCYLAEKNEIGACRMCVVEVKGAEKLVASCDTVCEDGMEVLTDSPRVLAARKTNLSLILSEHDSECTTCVRNQNCPLQSMAEEFNLGDLPYEKKCQKNKWDATLPIIKTNSKCIQCFRCVSVCSEVQSMNVWTLIGSGKYAHVGFAGGKSMDAAQCTYCGQCITHCPTGALKERDDTAKLLRALRDPETTVVLQVAPAVRSAWGEGLGLTKAQATEKRMAAAFKALGCDYVFDTNFTADLTIMEEGNEFLYKMTHPETFRRPLFTSCCPGWVRFMKLEYPDMVSQLSTAKSPQQMFGAVAKSYFAKKADLDPKKIFCVSIMPCTAKKYECDVEEVNSAAKFEAEAAEGATTANASTEKPSYKDVDLVLTTREVDRLLKQMNIDVASLEETEFDSPLGTGSGAAVIFGATGGVMEAALRTAAFVLTGKNPGADDFKVVRGTTPDDTIGLTNDCREFTITVNGITVRACVASGLKNARAVVEDVRSGRKEYDFVEIMACPGGCAGGGGQPIHEGQECAANRGQILYNIDKENTLRFSHENPDVSAAYEEFFGAPLSETSHHLLHTKQTEWKL